MIENYPNLSHLTPRSSLPEISLEDTDGNGKMVAYLENHAGYPSGRRFMNPDQVGGAIYMARNCRCGRCDCCIVSNLFFKQLSR